MSARLTVVVVSWQGAHLLEPCLDALERQTLPRELYEVWLVDNASTDGTADLVARRWPRVRVLRSERNLGFAGGCALALSEVATPWVALVNNDAVCAPDALQQLLDAALAGDGRLGALTAHLVLAERFVEVPPGTPGAVVLADGRAARAVAGSDRPDAFDVLNSTGTEVRRDGRGRDRGWLQPEGQVEHPADVFGFCGAAALLSMRAVRAAGGFDARYFLYYEDTDLSWRMRLAGWRCAYVPTAVVRHAHAQSTGEGSDLHLFHDDRNRLLTLVKCAPAAMAARVLLRYLVTVASIAAREVPGFRTTRVRIRSLVSLAGLLPHALGARRRVGRTAVVPRRDLLALLVPDDDRGRAYRSR